MASSRAQASIEYLLAIGLSFVVTLLVFAAIFRAVEGAKERAFCAFQKCEPLPIVPQQNLIDDKLLFYLASLLVVYFVEFFFVLVFLRRIARPEKKKLSQHSQY